MFPRKFELRKMQRKSRVCIHSRLARFILSPFCIFDLGDVEQMYKQVYPWNI